MKQIIAAGGVVTVERYGGLHLYLEEPLELNVLGELMALAVLQWYVREHHDAHPRTDEAITFSVGKDYVSLDTLDAAQVDHCLENLLAVIQTFGVLHQEERAA